MTKDFDAIAKGVSDSWDFWLSQHDVSTPECIIEATQKAFSQWLYSYGEDVIGAAVSRWLDSRADELIEAVADADFDPEPVARSLRRHMSPMDLARLTELLADGNET